MNSGDLVVDIFCGGGGASSGIKAALGYGPHIAINHDDEAVALHTANHPETHHICGDVWDKNPKKVVNGKPVSLLWASPDCFPAGTMVLTQEGYRPIEDIRVGDEVLTHKGRWMPVTRTYTARRPLVRLRGLGHPGLLVSPEHPFYARKRRDVWDTTPPRGYRRTLGDAEWVKAAELGKGWYWGSPTAFPTAEVPPVPVYDGRETTITERVMWLAGLYVADGWTRLTKKRAELVITCGKHESEKVRGQLSAWARRGKRAKSNELAWSERDTKTAHQFATGHRGLVEWLRQHFGHGASSKLVPGWVLGMRREYREAFMSGYLQGDGCVSHGTGSPLTIATTVSKALAFGLKALASSLGHTPAIALRTDQPDVIDGRKVNVRPSWSVKWRPIMNELHRHTIGNREDGIEWAPIREREDNVVAAADVFNIAVAEDESYVVDGVIVHNCTFFSKARGGKPFRDPKSATGRRALAWVVSRWAREVRPRVILMECVEELQQWCPLLPDGRPDMTRVGITYRRWVGELRAAGYAVEWKVLSAHNYGAPTTRKRLFVIARCDGAPIVWPAPTHGPGRLPYRTAASCIDWSIPVQSIFDRKKPLVEKTLARIARGLQRFVFDNADPFIVPLTHTGGDRVHDINEPLRTITGANRGELALVAPTLIQTGYGEREGQAPRSLDINAPLGTVVAGGAKHALVATFLARHYGGNENAGAPFTKPLPTITTQDHHAVVTATLGDEQREECTAFLLKYFGTATGQPVQLSLGTITTKERFAVVTVHGKAYRITDIGMRMLSPRELYRAQGFAETYEIAPVFNGKVLSKTAQIRMCGNSVAPPCAEALIRANLLEAEGDEVAA